jgi:hypothetical protein
VVYRLGGREVGLGSRLGGFLNRFAYYIDHLDFRAGLHLSDGRYGRGLRRYLLCQDLSCLGLGLRRSHSKVLNRLPDALDSDLAVRELGDGSDARNTVPNLYYYCVKNCPCAQSLERQTVS